MKFYYKHKSIVIGLVVLGLLTLAACAEMGIMPPQNTEQSIAYLYPAVATVRDGATAALQAKKITKAQAQIALTLADSARSAADVARDFVRNGDQSRAEASLSLAQTVLLEARKYVGLPQEQAKQ